MDRLSLASVLGHLAQTAERQTQLQQAQNEVLVELARSLATDRDLGLGLLQLGLTLRGLGQVSEDTGQ